MNKVLLLGYLANEPETKNFESKTNNEEQTIAKLTIAVNDNKNRNISYFINCVAWNQNAQYIGEKLHKGDFVAIDGRLTNRNYVNSEGKKVYVTEVQIDSIRNYGSKKANDEVVVSEPHQEYVVIDKTNANANKPQSNPTSSDSNNDWENDLE